MKYIIDDNDKNKHEAYTKQEVLNVIQEAISTGELPEELNGLVLTFKNPIDNKGYKIAFCTQAKYNELQARGQLEADCLYYITDDSTYDDLADAISDLNAGLTYFQQILGDLQGRTTSLENNYRGNAPYINTSTEQYENKTVTTPYNLTLTEGTELYVKFSYYGSDLPWSYMTLNVNNNGSQAIAFKGTPISTSDSQAWNNGDIVRLVYQYSHEIENYVWNVLENITQQIYFGTLYEA